MLRVTSMGSPAATIERVDLNDQVYTTLKEWLATRKLGPDEKLSLHELAALFGVSRSPVQHALTRLVADGLVSVEPRRGHFVTPLTRTIVANAHEVRLALELQAAERTVGNLDREALASLRRLMERTLPAVSGRHFSDFDAFIATNQSFHELQVDLAGNSLLSSLYRQLAVNLLMERILGGRKEAGNVAAEHIELVEAFEAGELPRVQSAIRAHVETGRRLAFAALESAGGIL
jgi:DNA-binding GntR family transcriptional regulator